MIPTVGVDPGGHWTGIVLRSGGSRAKLHKAEVLTRKGDTDDHCAIQPWLNQCVDLVEVYLELAAELAGVTVTRGLATQTIRLAVEGLVGPTGFAKGGRRPINPTHLIGTAAVYGHIAGTWPAAVVIRPGGHGDAPDASYPAAIRKGTRGLGGPPRHAQSAWDIAGASDHAAALRRALAVD